MTAPYQVFARQIAASAHALPDDVTVESVAPVGGQPAERSSTPVLSMLGGILDALYHQVRA